MLENSITIFLMIVLIFTVIFLDFGSRTARIIIYDCDALNTYDVVPEEVSQECSAMYKNDSNKKFLTV